MNRLPSLCVAALLAIGFVSVGCENNQEKPVNKGPAPVSEPGGKVASTGEPAGEKIQEEAEKIGEGVKEGTEKVGEAVTDAGEAVKEAVVGKKAVAKIIPSKAPGDDDVAGTVTFTETAKGIEVHAEITGLKPGKHGFHIHEKGDLSDEKFDKAGPHFNPSKEKHGDHAGDLANLEADDTGKADFKAVIEDVKLDDSEAGIIGRSVIIHEKEDDGKTDPSGNSGPRIAGGVIELEK